MARFSLLRGLLLTSAFALASTAFAAETPARDPLFLADLLNPHDFSLFANGGWDGNWYVGYNTCWMQRIAVPENKGYKRAYVGARLGRMKGEPAPGRPPWERKAYKGEIHVSIASSPAWNAKDSYFLAATDDIPLEPDFENAVEFVGESRWFWREIPIEKVRFGADNYLAVWSPSANLTSISSAPVLAAGWGNKEANSWLANDVKGAPPATPSKALSTPLNIFEPAIALKLVPDSPSERPRPRITRVADGKQRGRSPAPKVVSSRVEGEAIERAWIEISTDSKGWKKFGTYIWNAPYTFTLKSEDLPVGPEGKTWIRAAATDIYENTGYSPALNLFERGR